MTTSRWENQIVKTNGEIRKGYISIKLKPYHPQEKKYANIGTLPFNLELWGKKSMLPKCFSFLQFCMCFALLKNYKIPNFNAAMAIKTIVSVK